LEENAMQMVAWLMFRVHAIACLGSYKLPLALTSGQWKLKAEDGFSPKSERFG
jgi:hypothetical protein